MAAADLHHAYLIFLIVSTAAAASAAAPNNIGVNWGTQMSHPINPSIVVKMLKANGIGKVKLFDVDSWTMDALRGSGVEVMVAIPNYDLHRMSNNYGDAKSWVKENVTAYGDVNIKYVAVGNEPFLTSYNGSFLKSTLPALQNIQRALNDAGIGDRIKAVCPLNADVYDSPSNNPVPSAGDFRSDIHDLMVDMVKFLKSNNAPFVVNIYPFLSLQQNDNFPVEFAFFDGGRTINDKNLQYDNVFDANYDTLIWSLKKAGVGDLKIIVGEAGWPTDGDKNANVNMAKRFYSGFLQKLGAKKGTPLRPNVDMDVYLFGLLDENMKSTQPGNFERHWGIFSYDGLPKFPMDLSGKGNTKYLIAAEGIQYLPSQWCVLDPDSKTDTGRLPGDLDFACQRADCTPLQPGGSCSGLDQLKSVSYAFNIYYQMQDQDVRACDFGGQGKVTKKNASTNGCRFPVEIISGGEMVKGGVGVLVGLLIGVVMMLL